MQLNKENCYIIYKAFISFLKKEDCFDNFKNEWFRLNRMRPEIENLSIKQMIEFYFKKGEMHNIFDLIDHSFHWIETVNGHNYWRVISYKWFNYLKDKINN